MRLRRAERTAARTQESQESPRYPLKPFELKFEKIQPAPHPPDLTRLSQWPSAEANSHLSDLTHLHRTPDINTDNYESDFESYASILQSESASIYESLPDEQDENQNPPISATPQPSAQAEPMECSEQQQWAVMSEEWLRRVNKWLVRRIKSLREGVRELVENGVVLREQEGELLRLRAVRSHVLDLAYHSHLHQQAEQQVHRAKSTSHSLHAARNHQQLIRYRAVRLADNPPPLNSPQVKLARAREQLLTARRLEERNAVRLKELIEKEDRYEQLVDSCEGALSRVSEGGLEGRKGQLLRQIEERKQYYLREEMERTVVNTGLELEIGSVESQMAKVDQQIALAKEEQKERDFYSNNPESPIRGKAQWLKAHFRKKKVTNGRYSDFTRPLLPSST